MPTLFSFAFKNIKRKPLRTGILTGGHPNSVAALEKRLLAGAVLSFPTRYQARKSGFVELVDLGQEEVSYPGGALTVRRAYLEANSDLVRRMVKSYIEGVHRYRTDRAFAARTVARYARTTDLAAVDATYNGLTGALVDRSLMCRWTALSRRSRFWRAAGRKPPS